MAQHPASDVRHPQRIAVIRALFLGDLLMTVPAFRALRRRFPGAEITLISLPWAESFVPHIAEFIDRLVPFAGYRGIPEVPVDQAVVDRWITEQQQYGYDLAVQMHGDGNISNGLVAELGAPITLGFARPGDDRLTHSLPHKLDRNEVLRWLQLVAELGAPTDNTTIEFAIGARDRAAAATLLAQLPPSNGPIVALHVGAKEAIRRWSPARFAAVANALTDQIDARIVLTGSAHERDLIDAVQRELDRPALDTSGRTDVGAFAALLDQIDLVLTNDTGASHLAAAMRTPSVVLFGPTRPEQYAPLDRALHHAIDARAVIGSDVDGVTALQRLSPDVVIAACVAQIGSHGSRVAGRKSQADDARFVVFGSEEHV